MDALAFTYWISIVVVVITTLLAKRFLIYEGKNIPRIFIIMLCGISFIPIVGTIEAVGEIVWGIFAISDGNLKLKEKPFKNSKINSFFLD